MGSERARGSEGKIGDFVFGMGDACASPDLVGGERGKQADREGAVAVTGPICNVGAQAG